MFKIKQKNGKFDYKYMGVIFFNYYSLFQFMFTQLYVLYNRCGNS